MHLKNILFCQKKQRKTETKAKWQKQDQKWKISHKNNQNRNIKTCILKKIEVKNIKISSDEKASPTKEIHFQSQHKKHGSQWRRYGVFNVNFEHILHIFLVFLSFPLNRYMSAGIQLDIWRKLSSKYKHP